MKCGDELYQNHSSGNFPFIVIDWWKLWACCSSVLLRLSTCQHTLFTIRWTECGFTEDSDGDRNMWSLLQNNLALLLLLLRHGGRDIPNHSHQLMLHTIQHLQLTCKLNTNFSNQVSGDFLHKVGPHIVYFSSEDSDTNMWALYVYVYMIQWPAALWKPLSSAI